MRRIATSGFAPGSDAVFHWHVGAGELPENPLSPLDPALRQYTRRSLRFASAEITAMAMVQLHINKLMEIALICLESDKSTYGTSVGHWLEILAFAQLRVSLSSLSSFGSPFGTSASMIVRVKSETNAMCDTAQLNCRWVAPSPLRSCQQRPPLKGRKLCLICLQQRQPHAGPHQLKLLPVSSPT